MGDQRNGGIAWTDETWNPLRGCRRVSPGCVNCYAETMAHRFSGPGKPYEGLTTITKKGPRWSGKGMEVPGHLGDPLRWTRARRVFVNSMSDLFFEPFAFDYIAAVYGVMYFAPDHTFQVLTKRPERGLEFHRWLMDAARAADPADLDRGIRRVLYDRMRRCLPPGPAKRKLEKRDVLNTMLRPWPLSNVWLGVSVESQPYANERLHHLRRIPCAVRFVSYEPALEAVNFRCIDPRTGNDHRDLVEGRVMFDALTGPNRVDWIIVGGESGNGARPFYVEWARSVVKQCDDAGIAPFVKQLGAVPIAPASDAEHYGAWGRRDDGTIRLILDHDKGEDLEEFPPDIQRQEFPEVAA